MKYLLTDGYNGGEPLTFDTLDEARDNIRDIIADHDRGYSQDRVIEGLALFEVGREITINVIHTDLEVELDGVKASEPDFASVLAANPPLPRESARQYCARVGACPA